MEGYHPETYGERFADVYDDWYPGVAADDERCAERLAALSEGHPILELAAGTGRISLRLAALGVPTVALDNSPAMLDRLRTKARTANLDVTVVEGDMIDPPTACGSDFGVVFIAYNSLFCLTGDGQQRDCLTAARDRLRPGGSFMIEAFAPVDSATPHEEGVTVRDLTVERVVLHVSRSDRDRQESMSQLVEITERGIRLRPVHLRWSTPDQLDEMAADAGLELVDRWADWSGSPFTDDSPGHVTRYRRNEV